MLFTVLALLLPALPPPQYPERSPREPAPTLFVLNKSAGDVSVVDPRSGETRARIAVGEGPHEAAVSPDGKLVVVCNYGGLRKPGSTLSVIDVPRGEVVRTVALEGYHRPHGIQFRSLREVVVTAEQERKLLVVDVGEGAVRAAIDTGQELSHMVALSPSARRAYVANIGSGSISVLDLEGQELLKVIPTGAGAEGVAVHPRGHEVWVTNRAADTVTVVDTAKLEVVAEVACASFPIRVAFTPEGRHALVSCARTGDVAVFDVAERKLARRIAMNEEAVGEPEGRLFADAFGNSPVPIGILIPGPGERAYVANTMSDIVTVLDLSVWKILRRIETGREPDGLAWVAGS